MRLIGKSKLEKYKRKNRGNVVLFKAIDQLVEQIEDERGLSEELLNQGIANWDRVHNDGFYFVDIGTHRVLVLIELDEEGEASIVWIGSHSEYVNVFKNNKATIARWLRIHEYIR